MDRKVIISQRVVRLAKVLSKLFWLCLPESVIFLAGNLLRVPAQTDFLPLATKYLPKEQFIFSVVLNTPPIFC